jgi:hypothetical protein
MLQLMIYHHLLNSKILENKLFLVYHFSLLNCIKFILQYASTIKILVHRLAESMKYRLYIII